MHPIALEAFCPRLSGKLLVVSLRTLRPCCSRSMLEKGKPARALEDSLLSTKAQITASGPNRLGTTCKAPNLSGRILLC